MNYPRLGLAALGGMVASFAFGFLVISLVPSIIDEHTSTRQYSDLKKQ